MSIEKIAYYNTLRTRARKAVASSLNHLIRQYDLHHNWNKLTLASIEPDAINHARLEWPKFYSDETHQGFAYSWDKLNHKFAGRPAHFNLAIWQQVDEARVLQALALGKPSRRGKTHLTLNWIERSFAPTYAQGMRGGVLLPILACAQEYAKLLGCKRVLIKDPIDPDKYQRYGYHPYRLEGTSEPYMSKDLRYDDPDEG